MGYLIDRQSFPIYVNVQMKNRFSTQRSTIPFDVEKLNVGGAMNLTSGTFTAPKPGIYHFPLAGVSERRTGALRMWLQLNGYNVGGIISDQQSDGSFALEYTLHLRQAGDRITLFVFGGDGVN